MGADIISAIKSFEGFTPRAKWDYAQHTNGYGTKAAFAGEVVTRAEAEKRFRIEIDEARRFVERHAKGWDDGTKAALTSLTFNAGTLWVTSGLGEALRRGDVDGVRARFLQYTRAQGEVLQGLVRRRAVEAAWIGNPDAINASPGPMLPSKEADGKSVNKSAMVVSPEESWRAVVSRNTYHSCDDAGQRQRSDESTLIPAAGYQCESLRQVTADLLETMEGREPTRLDTHQIAEVRSILAGDARIAAMLEIGDLVRQAGRRSGGGEREHLEVKRYA